jgi:hypothetical protein
MNIQHCPLCGVAHAPRWEFSHSGNMLRIERDGGWRDIDLTRQESDLLAVLCAPGGGVALDRGADRAALRCDLAAHRKALDRGRGLPPAPEAQGQQGGYRPAAAKEPDA